MNAQQVFQSIFNALINDDSFIKVNIEKYQSVLEHALSKVDYSIGTGIYILPSSLNMSIGKATGYNNKILISSTDLKIGSNKKINKSKQNLNHL